MKEKFCVRKIVISRNSIKSSEQRKEKGEKKQQSSHVSREKSLTRMNSMSIIGIYSRYHRNLNLVCIRSTVLVASSFEFWQSIQPASGELDDV